MSRWLDLAARMQAGDEPRANSANSANSCPEPVAEGPNGTNGTNGTTPLPTDIVAGLKRLGGMAAPRITRPEVWPQVVADAQRLVAEGWAAQAIGLGWAPLHLWGCSPEKGGNEAQDGLAVVLAGRRIVLLDDRSAIIESAAGTRRVFNVLPMAGAVMLWELGNGRARG